MLAGAAAWLAYSERFELEAWIGWVAGFGAAAPLLFLLARALGAVVLVPGSLMAIAAGLMFGLIWGAILNLVASTAGAVLAFLIARYVAPDWIARRVAGRERFERLVAGIEAEGWRFVAFVRLVPLFPYNLLNYALGLTRIRLVDYALASLVCMIPGDIAYVYIGTAARAAMTGSERAWQLGLIGLGLLACLIFLPGFIRRYRAS